MRFAVQPRLLFDGFVRNETLRVFPELLSHPTGSSPSHVATASRVCSEGELHASSVALPVERRKLKVAELKNVIPAVCLSLKRVARKFCKIFNELPK